MPRVVIGNVHDLDRERLRRVGPRLRRVSAARRRNVYDANSETFVDDETGLTVHHEIDPEVKASLQRLSETAKNRGLWLAVGGGILLGLLLAGIVWWSQNGGKSSKR